ncbi:MAG TPA: hypothetical protein PKI49_14940, partial [Pseudomonadota bacterium]|nr:hypothetical protein [Pseudomonadota bacterium]
MNRRLSRSWFLVFPTVILTGSLVFSSSCQKKAVCDDVVGSCLALTVEGPGTYDALRTELQLPSQTRIGNTTGNIDLPLTLRV